MELITVECFLNKVHIATMNGPFSADMFWLAFDVHMVGLSGTPEFSYWLNNEFEFYCNGEIRPYTIIGCGGYDENGRIWLRGIQYKVSEREIY